MQSEKAPAQTDFKGLRAPVLSPFCCVSALLAGVYNNSNFYGRLLAAWERCAPEIGHPLQLIQSSLGITLDEYLMASRSILWCTQALFSLQFLTRLFCTKQKHFPKIVSYSVQEAYSCDYIYQCLNYLTFTSGASVTALLLPCLCEFSLGSLVSSWLWATAIINGWTVC